MEEGAAHTIVEGEGSSAHVRVPKERSAVFREDDATYKARLKRNLVNHWLLNTVTTLVLFTVVFYLLTRNLLVGILAGLLALLVTNLYNVLWKIRQFERWEVFSNGVKLGYDPQGNADFLMFRDIEGIEIRQGLIGEVFIIQTRRRRLKYDYAANREILDLLRKRYIAFKSISGDDAGRAG